MQVAKLISKKTIRMIANNSE